MRAALRRTRTSNRGSLKSNTYRLRNIFCTSVRNQKTNVDMAPPYTFPRFLRLMATADVQINACRPGGEYIKRWSMLRVRRKGEGPDRLQVTYRTHTDSPLSGRNRAASDRRWLDRSSAHQIPTTHFRFHRNRWLSHVERQHALRLPGSPRGSGRRRRPRDIPRARVQLARRGHGPVRQEHSTARWKQQEC